MPVGRSIFCGKKIEVYARILQPFSVRAMMNIGLLWPLAFLPLNDIKLVKGLIVKWKANSV